MNLGHLNGSDIFDGLAITIIALLAGVNPQIVLSGRRTVRFDAHKRKRGELLLPHVTLKDC
jgi:hypothetical protein